MEEKIQQILSLCQTMDGTDPVKIAKALMADPLISIHGPEHHILDGAALLTSLHNAGEDFDLTAALEELAVRGQKMPGATCGQWGVCGSASSVGAALSIFHGTGPLSDNEFYKDNMRLTSRVLDALSQIGGPRCCKRNGFLALTTAVNFIRERYGIQLAMEEIRCEFSPRNKQCIGTRCPFFKEEA